ncbi:MAG: sigma-70 family RNA polymerase sigma factor [Acidimicrobiales bacterium]|nr:sigma-70 family RNA polymerase sigma factor [Acidimicrobiales bacterium]
MDDTTALAQRASNGDQQAFDALVRATQADVWRWCARLVDVQSADDLTQETYLRAARALHGFRGEGTGRSFLLGVAKRVCLDELRRRGRRDALHQRLRQRASRQSAHAPGADRSLPLEDLIATLPEERREAFVLTQVLGLSYAEAADTLGVPVGTIRSRVARARDDLIGRIDDSRRAGEA